MWFKLILVKALLFVLTLTGQNQAVQDTINNLPPDLKAEAAIFLTQTATPEAANPTETPDAPRTPAAEVTETPDAAETPQADETETPEADADEDEGEDFKVVGVLTAISGDAWTVNGISYIVTGAEMDDATPHIGDTVKIELLRNADDSLRVKSVEVESSDDGQSLDDSGDQDDDHGGSSGEHQDDESDDQSDDSGSNSGGGD